MTIAPPITPRTRGKTLFLTFYSFKGGVGRTMSLLNAACILAARGRRVLLIDFDLEAPGLTTLRDLTPQHDQPRQHPGLVELIHDFLRDPNASALADKANKTRFRDEYVCDLEIPAHLERIEGGSLSLMPAGCMDDTYGKRLNAIKFDQLYEEGIGQPLFKLLKSVILQSKLYDYVLIDSRTGFSDEGGICTRDLADHIFVVMGLNRQNVDGTVRFLQSLKRSSWQEGRVFFIVSPMPIFYEELRDERLKEAQSAIQQEGYKTDLDLRVPYHPRLALDEEPFVYHWSETNLFDAYQRIHRQIRALNNDTPREWSGETLRAVQAGKYDHALHLLKQIRLENSDSAVNLLSFITTQKAAESSTLRKHLSPFFDFWIDIVGEEIDVLRRYGTALREDRKYSRAEEKLNRYLEVAREQKNDGQIANAYYALGLLRADQCRFTEALVLYRNALDAGKSLEDQSGDAYIHGSIGEVYRLAAFAKKALLSYREAHKLFVREDDKNGVASIRLSMGLAYMSLGEYKLALKSCNQSYRFYKDAADRTSLASANMIIGYIRMLRGESDIVDIFNEAEIVFTKADNQGGVAGVQQSLGYLHQLHGRYELAMEQYAKALAYYRQSNDHTQVCAVLGEIGKTQLLMGDVDNGSQTIQQANSIAEQIGVLEVLAEGRVDYSNALFRLQKPKDALAYLNEHWTLVQEHGTAHVRAEANVLRAKIRLALGNPVDAQTDLQAALEFYNSQQVHTPLAKEAAELAASFNPS